MDKITFNITHKTYDLTSDAQKKKKKKRERKKKKWVRQNNLKY